MRQDHCWWCHRLVIQEGADLIAPFTLGAPEICDANPNGHESTNDILDAAERYERVMRHPTAAELDELRRLAPDS